MEMEDDGEEARLIGIILTNDNDYSQGTCLGLIQISHYHLSNISLADVRTLICAQLNHLPRKFGFSSNRGWPITHEQERYVKARHVLSDEGTFCIQRLFDSPRIGVKAKSGMSLGFVFVEYDCCVDKLRNIVENQLPFFRGMSSNYQFLDMNGWPISTAQESHLSVLDILTGSCIIVCTDVSIRATIDFQSTSRDSFNSDTVGPVPKRVRGLRELSYRSSKDVDRRHSDDSGSTEQTEPKQILISYVRAEAAQHALDLKQYLSDLGYSVYLDVHEIKTGVDWQDSLNFAVTNCEVFVPLVTPRYGETQWTNREVKLADVLSKFILPVSFLPDWPPRCLAIQFATTQYIYYRKQAADGEMSPVLNGCAFSHTDSRLWNDNDVRHVALEIGHRISTFRETTARGLVLVKQTSMLKSYPSGLPPGVEGLDEVTSDRDGKPLIVISLHPDQSDLGDELTKLLENQNYEVWCSTALDFAEEDTIRLSEGDLQALRASQSSQSCDTTDSSVDSRKHFQDKANQAGLVIVVLSRSFAQSRTCQQQVYYCEHRKRMIPFVFEEFTFPGWLSMLLGNVTIESMKSAKYKENLLSRVKMALDPSANENAQDEINEARLMQFVERVWKQIPRENCVYISGGTKFYNPSSQKICRAIGQCLARLDGVTLVTGGFYGVMEAVSQGFYEETQRVWKRHKVWHILPERDSSNLSKKALQNRDGTFKAVNFGKTMFCGSSVRERETIVARAFDVCVLVEGGPGSAHEAEQFAWNDKIVIPIRSTGGAAGGSFGVPQKIFKVPQCVSESDWAILSRSEADPTEIGEAVARIISSVFKNLKVNKSSPGKKVIAKGKRSLKSQSETRSKPSLTTMKTIILG